MTPITFSSQIQQIQQLFLSTKNTQKLSQQTTLIEHKQNSQGQNVSEKLQPAMKIILNSLKLNQKLYNSIIQKQTQIQNQTKNFLNNSIQTQHKLQQALKRTKQLYEETVHQNQKSKFMLQQFITPIKQELRSKVDETTFSLQMKLLLDEYDAIGHQITYDMNEQQKLKQQKRKTIQSQTLSFLKQRVLPILSDLQHKFISYQQKNTILQNNFEDLKSKTHSLDAQLKSQNLHIIETESKIMNIIDQKIDEKTAEKKTIKLFESLIHQNNQIISTQIKKSHEFSKKIQSNLESQISIFKSEISETLKKLDTTQNSLIYQLKNHQKLFQTKLNKFQKHEIQLEEINNRMKKIDKNLDFVHKFHQQFLNLQTKVQNSHFKAKSEINKQEIELLLKKLNDFQIESKRIKKFEKQYEERSLILRGQLQGIRDILSKKANFSDILMHMQSKVDKQQFKELKQHIQEVKQQKVTCQGKVQQLRETQHSQTSKKKHHLRNRLFFSPMAVEKLDSSTQLQTQDVKRFKLGITSDFVIPTQSTRKYSKTYHLRQSIKDNNSNIFKPITQS